MREVFAPEAFVRELEAFARAAYELVELARTTWAGMGRSIIIPRSATIIRSPVVLRWAPLMVPLTVPLPTLIPIRITTRTATLTYMFIELER